MTAQSLQRDERRAPRSPVECRATARIALSMELLDASALGVRARMSIPLPVGTTLKISLPGGVERHARIVWVKDREIGCEFLAELNPKELDTLLIATPLASPR
ncbi:MAG: PilZ domain-containing protein [Sphingomonas bacterium]